MPDIAVHYFPPEALFPDEILPEIMAGEADLLDQEYNWMYDQIGVRYRRTVQYTPDEWNEDRNNYKQHVCVAVEQSRNSIELLGFIIFRLTAACPYYLSHRMENVASIAGLYVMKAHRGKGVATTLLTYVNMMLKQLKVKNCVISHNAHNYNADKLYLRMKFRGLSTGYMGKPRAISVPKDLLEPILFKKLTQPQLSKMRDQLKSRVAADSQLFYPMYGLTSEIVGDTFDHLRDRNLPVYIFAGDHGWASLETDQGQFKELIYPTGLTITKKGLTNPKQIHKYLYFLSQEGQRLYRAPVLTFELMDSNLMSLVQGAGLKPWYHTKMKSVY